MFPCGGEGYILSHAAKRFEKLHKELNHIREDLTTYLHLSELCFHKKLEKLAIATSRNRVPNSESCLLFEKQAITAMNECFKEDSRLCTLLSNSEQADQQTLHEQLQSVVEAFRVGGPYFNSTVVDMGIPEAIKGCGHSELAESMLSTKLPVRVTWCALFETYGGESPLNETQLIERLSKELNRTADQFVFSGPDNLEVCSQFVTTEVSYSIISWFASPDDPKLSELPKEFTQRNPGVYVEFHDAKDKEREFSQCGDGIRQAGEMCDFAGNVEGCDQSCNPNYGYKCSTSRLTPSECVFEESQSYEHPVICEPSPRRSQSVSSSRSRVQTVSSDTPVDSDKLFDTQLAGSALSVRTMNLPLLILIAVFCLWIPKW